MSSSGVPGVSQAASAVSSIGSAIGGVASSGFSKLFPQAPDPAAAPAAANPDTNQQTAEQMTQAAQAEDQNTGRGEAANMLSGPDGEQDAPKVSRALLLGN